MTRTRLIVVGAVWVIVTVALWLSDTDPSAIALAGIVAVAAAVGLVAFDLGIATQRLRWPAPPVASWTADGAGEDIPRTLREIDAVVRAHPTALQRRLDELVERRSDGRPLTENLQRVRAGPYRKMPSPAELDRIIDDIEEL